MDASFTIEAGQGVGYFAYDASTTSKRRKAVPPLLRTEDKELLVEQRRRLVSNARDLPRNLAIAAWMVRRHLDYVSRFTFEANSGDAAFDDTFEKLMRTWSHRKNCDVTGRNRLSKIIRIGEARRTLDGDVLFVKLAVGKLQAIEADRLRSKSTAAEPQDGKVVDGVKLDNDGAAVGYQIWKRVGQAEFAFERELAAENCYLHRYAENRFDQVRGVSPLAPAIDPLRDIYESFDYARAKMKLAQMMGLVHNTAEPGDAEQNLDMTAGPIFAQLGLDDTLSMLESKNPSTESQAFWETMISMCLKALDIPYSFYNESFTNYSGSRQALLQYEESAKQKREDNQELLDDITLWKAEQWMDDGLLERRELDDLAFAWLPAGLPWIDPLKEREADLLGVDGNITSRRRICKAHGDNFFQIVDELAEEDEYIATKRKSNTAKPAPKLAAAPADDEPTDEAPEETDAE